VGNSIINGHWQDWKISFTSNNATQPLQSVFNLPDWVAQFLVNRNLSSLESSRIFLYPSLNKLPDPGIFPDIENAVEHIRKAILSHHTIAVFGDYDVDGITGTTVLTDFLSSLGANVLPVIPNRFKHGYGLNSRVIDQLASRNVKLIITVDCGITSVSEVEHASRLGIETIITDHHQPGTTLPRAISIINPHLVPKDNEDANVGQITNLAGVGVAFYLAIALRKHLRAKGFWTDSTEPNLKKYLDLVALGTIADQVPITGVNRILCKFGLLELGESRRPGIRALVEVCKLKNKQISVWDVGFLLAPRINAAGRMGSEHLALQLMLSSDYEVAGKLALELDKLNRERQDQEEQILREATSLLDESSGHWNTASSIVLAKDDWHRGIIGIVASRLVERFGKPVILLGKNQELWEGSARSVPGLNIFKALSRCDEFLEKYGGHKMAAGLKLLPSNMVKFRDRFNEVAAEKVPPSGVRRQLMIDAKLNLQDITPLTMKFIEELSPYGIGNPRPLFLLESFGVKAIKILKEKHLSLQIEQNGKSMRAVGFNMVDDPDSIPSSFRYLAFYPVYNTWEGNTYIDLRIVDFC